MEPLWALGLMSGTSLDGVDAAWLLTDGQEIMEVGGGMTVPYPNILRKTIRAILGQKKLTEEIQAIEQELTLFHGEVVRQAQRVQKFDLIGFHGQTIFHAPPQTWQIGNGELLAEDVGVEVVCDFRSEDVAKGGQGAPLVPIFHQAMVEEEYPVVVANIGGVANITWIQKGQPLIACDTGPGGALLDDWILQKTGKLYDLNGQLAAKGKINEEIVQRWLTHPYFAKPAPKSLDRNDFIKYLKDIEGLSLEDGAATLIELTVRALVDTLAQIPDKPHKIYVAGGGRRNQYFMNRLAQLAPCSIDLVESLNWNGDFLEAYAFAYLAARVKAGLPTSFPTTTGVKYPVCGGRLYLK
ncbi:MAG: anhydro-N-acetylmuramic acid kinase [Candidatus Paracaedibacter sp.]